MHTVSRPERLFPPEFIKNCMAIINVTIQAGWSSQTFPALLHDQPNHDNHNEIMEYGKRSKYWEWVPLRLRPVDLKIENKFDNWNWHRKISRAMDHSSAKTWVLECQSAKEDGLFMTQGVIVFEPRESLLCKGKHLIYIHLLGVAPHNRRFGWWMLALPGKYRGVKKRLLERATQESQAQNMGGRIGLFAVPGTESLYSRLGLTKTDIKKDEKTYFEGTIKSQG